MFRNMETHKKESLKLGLHWLHLILTKPGEFGLWNNLGYLNETQEFAIPRGCFSSFVPNRQGETMGGLSIEGAVVQGVGFPRNNTGNRGNRLCVLKNPDLF